MKPDFIRQMLRPLFGSDRHDLTAGILRAIFTGLIVVSLLIFVFHQSRGGGVFDGTSMFLVGLFASQFLLLFLLRRGYINQSAVILVMAAWIGITYQAWRADGIHDAAIYAYMLLIGIAAFIISWRVSLALSVLSVVTIWMFAVAEARGLRAASLDLPLNIARDLTAIFALFVLLIILVVNTLRQTLEQMQNEFAERSRAEQALRVGEERFRKIFNFNPVAINVTSLVEGRLIDANNAYWNLTGFDRETSIGRTTVELKVWDKEEERQNFVSKLLRYKSLHNPAYEFFNERGEYRATVAFYELIDLGDTPTILSMFYDVTDQRVAQLAVQQSEERFRKVFQNSPVAIVITTLADGRLIDANQAFWKLSGHDPETSVGRTAFELRQGLQAAERNKFVAELLEKRSIQKPTYDFVNDNGQHLKTVAFYELIDEGGVPAILSMFYDMTEQNNAREALIHSEARVRALLEATPDMIFELARDGTIVQFIPSADQEPLQRPGEIIGKNIAQIFPVMAAQVNFATGRALDSGQVNAFEYQLPEDAGKIFEVRITPAGPDMVLATIRDVSLRKWAESERDKLIDELESKNAELERFTYTVSHDLKSPLITIKGFIGYVREDVQKGNMDRFESDLQRISDATEKMQHLLADLLELSRIGRLTNEPAYIVMQDLITQVLELLHGRISAGNIMVHVGEDLPAVYGDRQRLFEVFQNLIDNAAKFMGDQPAPRIDIGVQGKLNGNVIFFVRDNGIGIAPQFKDKIFGLFDKLNAQSDGTGIGLALVKRIIEFHKGRIWVESEVGAGATFFLALPTQPETGDMNK
ncbi:MAG: PAS domain S-box protein [Chloroflexota bacterium]